MHLCEVLFYFNKKKGILIMFSSSNYLYNTFCTTCNILTEYTIDNVITFVCLKKYLNVQLCYYLTVLTGDVVTVA